MSCREVHLPLLRGVGAVVRAGHENPGAVRKPGVRQNDDGVNPGERCGVPAERPADRELAVAQRWLDLTGDVEEDRIEPRRLRAELDRARAAMREAADRPAASWRPDLEVTGDPVRHVDGQIRLRVA